MTGSVYVFEAKILQKLINSGLCELCTGSKSTDKLVCFERHPQYSAKRQYTASLIRQMQGEDVLYSFA